MTNSKISTVLSEILLEGVDVHRCAAARALGQIADQRSAGALQKALLDEDPDVRADAASALGEIAAHGSTGDCAADYAGALMENLLGDPECDVKKAAIAALVEMDHRPLIPVLHSLVVSRGDEIAWDEDEIYTDGWDSWLDIQLMAIKGLGEFGAEEAVPEIVAALDDEMGQDISETAISALVKLGRPGAEALSRLMARGDARRRRRIADALSASSSPDLDALRDRCLGDDSAEVRLPVAVSMAKQKPADPRLEPLFDDLDARVRMAMVTHAGARFPGLVRQRMDDPNSAVRAAAFAVVASCPELFTEDGLADTVRTAISGEPGVATQAALAWVALVGEDALPALGRSLNDAQVPIAFRIGVIGSLQKIGRACVPYLLSVAGDENRQLRLATLTALADFAARDAIWPNSAGDGLLAALSGELVPEPEEIPEDTPVETPEEFLDNSPIEFPVDLPPETDRPSETDLETDDGSGPESAAPAQEQRAPSTLDLILSGQADKAEAGVEEEAAPAPIELTEDQHRLMALSKQRAISKKKIALESTVPPHLDVPRFAARLLGDVVHPDVTAHLIAALAGDDGEMHQAALNSLVQHGEKLGSLPKTGLEPLLTCIGGENADLRRLAVRALGWLDSEGVDQTLQGLLCDNDPHIRLEAVRALDLRGVADDRILACLKDEYSGVRLAAAAALARHRGPEVAGPLVEFAFADDGMYRRDVGRILGAFAREPATEKLLGILADDSLKRHWLVAIEALAEMYQQPEPQIELKVA
jgi:HEAT repeat protein